jgi:uncharacterized protein
MGMTTVDERGRVPSVDSAAQERLARALDRDGVVAAALFGSQASGRAGPLSDIDVAVWLDPGVEPTLDRRLELTEAATGALGTGEVDLVILNGAPPLLRHRAVQSQRIVLDRDPKARLRLEARALTEYLDTKPLRAELARGLSHRIAEGRFGRR